ncbi:MAG: hypothetical protein NUV55_12610 [Sulfuricaulis sp.]|uniref:hypothetical protein n=1 Tax=Sulfuricaulis sp. TaxID=2003553 RepID=UPI0025D22292|nr:hypothetical protein [Sulfuricaulis sp.]MCR4348023.1 hypothetical protein [Sulfuricaulis sp.]
MGNETINQKMHIRAFRWGIFIPVLVSLAVLFARWIFVIGSGDFGMDYELASRLMADQWQSRDFFSVYPPISGYSLLLFMKMLGHSYLVVNIHLWFWWLINVGVVAWLMRTYGASAVQVAFVMMTVALLTVPPNNGGKSVELIASALSGFAVVCMLRYSKTGKSFLAILAGGAGGVAILVKPNVGVAIVMALIAVSGAIALVQHEARPKYLMAGLLVLIGAVAGALVAVAIPGWYGGYSELVTEILVGGSQIKGGILALALRVFPRISTTFEPPFRYIVELGISLPLLGLFTIFFGRLLHARSKDQMGAVDANTPIQEFAEKLLWLLCGIIIALSVWSLWPQEFPHRFASLFYDFQLVSLPFFLWQLLYLMVVVALVVSLAAGIIRKEYSGDITQPFWVSFICLIWTLGIVASGRHNSVFAAMLFMPMLVLQYGRGRERAFYRMTIALLVLWTAAWHLAPNWKSTFSQLTRLPGDSKFSGLYWPEGGASVPGSYPVWSSSKTIEEVLRNVSPRLEGKNTLWLVPGPGIAFGGKVYSYGIHGLSANNVPPLAEKKFGDGVRANPPEYIVSSTFDEWEDRKWSFMRPEVVVPWLRENYRLVWKLTDNPAPLFLWEKK